MYVYFLKWRNLIVCGRREEVDFYLLFFLSFFIFLQFAFNTGPRLKLIFLLTSLFRD